VQRTYGKQGVGDIMPLVDIFISDLSDYKPEQIIEAVRIHRQTDNNFPTVASIRAILDPQPKFDYAFYTKLLDKQKRGEYLNSQEHQYIKSYEQNIMKGL
jgi:hypothetical protein